MKSHVAQKDTAKESSKTASRPAAAGTQTLSAAPPAYGIGFVDELLTDGPTASAQPAPLLQREAVASAPPPESAPNIVHQVLRSPGQPLDAATRQLFEPRFGCDLGSVRVHDDSRAAESAAA